LSLPSVHVISLVNMARSFWKCRNFNNFLLLLLLPNWKIIIILNNCQEDAGIVNTTILPSWIVGFHPTSVCVWKPKNNRIPYPPPITHTQANGLCPGLNSSRIFHKVIFIFIFKNYCEKPTNNTTRYYFFFKKGVEISAYTRAWLLYPFSRIYWRKGEKWWSWDL